MTGWFLDVDWLRQIVPGQPLMRFNTGLSLFLLALASVAPRAVRTMAAMLAAAIGGVVLAEYAFDIRQGIDQLVVTDPDHASAHPGRMAVATAASIVLLAAGRVLLDAGQARGARGARWLGFGVATLTTLTLLAYAYNASWIYNLRPVSTNVMNTAASLLLLALSLLAGAGAADTWAAQPTDAGRILVRRLLPVALLGLPVLGALALLAQRHHLFPATTTAAVVVVACAVVVSVVSWDAAHRLARLERRRAAAITELTELKVDLERQVSRRASQLQQRHNEIAVLEDRQRIAADLHDVVIQRLFAAGMFLQGGAATAADPDTRHRLDTAVESMDAAIKDLRASIFELGGRREPTNLTSAVDDVCVESARVLGFMPDLIVDDPDYCAERVRDDILAVLREALANVARHAQARSVAVVLRSDGTAISLTVTDDGVGMGATRRASGTRNMLARAREHGGDCNWSPVEPHGTRVCWTLPVANADRS